MQTFIKSLGLFLFLNLIASSSYASQDNKTFESLILSSGSKVIFNAKAELNNTVVSQGTVLEVQSVNSKTLKEYGDRMTGQTNGYKIEYWVKLRVPGHTETSAELFCVKDEGAFFPSLDCNADVTAYSQFTDIIK